MKVGDYIITKTTFNRIAYSVTRDNNTIVTNIVNKGNITFNENTKYKIIKIFKTDDVNVIEIESNSITVNFSLEHSTKFEYLYDLFYIDNTIMQRSKKLKKLNKISKINKFKEFFKL